MAVAQSLLRSTPPFGNRDGSIIVRLTFSSTYAGHVLDLDALDIPHLSPEDISFLTPQRVGGAADGKDYRFGPNLTVSGATNATPIVVTTAQPHNLADGDTVTIASVGGNTNANGTHYVDVASATTFAIYSDAALSTGIAGNGLYTSDGTVTKTPATDWVGVVRLYTAGTSTEASSTVATTVDIPIIWRKGIV